MLAAHVRFMALLFFYWAIAGLFWLQQQQPIVAIVWLIASHALTLVRYYLHNTRLRTVEWQYHQLLTATHALPDGILLLDAEDNILWINQKLTDHLGLVSSLVTHKSAKEVFSALPELIQFIASNNYLRPVSLDTPKNAQVRKVLVQAIPLQKKQKLIVTQDITALDKLNTTRQDFVANVSHELRTPLTSILGFLETLQEANLQMDAVQQEKILRIVYQQALRMQNLVADLLTLSTLESSSIEAQQSIDLGQLLYHLQPQIMNLNSKQHRISWSIAERLSIMGNPGEIQSAVTNLITNAIRYTPEQGAIDISWQPYAEGFYIFSVKDTGQGIAPEHLGRITERFYRVDKGRSRDAGGTGLGLAIVKHIAIRHQAKLEIQSTIGMGSCFSLIFKAQRNG